MCKAFVCLQFVGYLRPGGQRPWVDAVIHCFVVGPSMMGLPRGILETSITRCRCRRPRNIEAVHSLPLLSPSKTILKRFCCTRLSICSEDADLR